jgi:hypothetical protein
MVTSPPSGALGDQAGRWVDKRSSQSVIRLGDLPTTLAAALTPSPSCLALRAISTVATGVLSRAIGVPLRSLKRRWQALHRYCWSVSALFRVLVPFLTTCSLWQWMQFIVLEALLHHHSSRHSLRRQCLYPHTGLGRPWPRSSPSGCTADCDNESGRRSGWFR